MQIYDSILFKEKLWGGGAPVAWNVHFQILISKRIKTKIQINESYVLNLEVFRF